jgi:hypothetical protein
MDVRPARVTVIAIAIFIVTEPIDGIPCFQTGYAVRESERRKGLGLQTLESSLAELRHGMSRTPMVEFYVEAVVGTANEASNRIAAKLLSDQPEAITDEISDESAWQYLRLVKIH